MISDKIESKNSDTNRNLRRELQMLYIQIITIIALLLTVFFSYDEYKKGTMKLRNFKIICVCEGVALLGMIYLILA